MTRRLAPAALGLLALGTLLGYRYLAQAHLSDLVLILAALPIIAFMGLGVYRMVRHIPDDIPNTPREKN